MWWIDEVRYPGPDEGEDLGYTSLVEEFRSKSTTVRAGTVLARDTLGRLVPYDKDKHSKPYGIALKDSDPGGVVEVALSYETILKRL